MSGKRGKMSRIGFVLASALRSVDRANLLNFARIEREWGKIVGPQLGAVSAPAKLSYRTLNIWVSEPVWADSMTYLKSEIIRKVNETLGKEVIDDVRVMMKSDFRQSGAAETGKQKAASADVPESEREEIRRVAAEVEDSQLRSILERVMLKNAKTRLDRDGSE